MQNITYNKNQEPLVVSKITFDILLQEEKPADLIALYHFYYYTAKWQNSNNVKATTTYTARGLKWSTDRVRKNKKRLIELGFLKDVQKRDEQNKITGHFIQVNLIWESKATLPQKPPYGETHSVDSSGGNALRSNSINTITINKNVNNKLFTIKKNNKIHSLAKIKVSQFDLFWHIYPNKKAKGAAKKAWERLCGKADAPTWQTIQRALKAQKQSERWREGDPKYIKHPATWLNNYGWLDDPEDMKIPDFAKQNNGWSAGYVGSKQKYKQPKVI